MHRRRFCQSLLSAAALGGWTRVGLATSRDIVARTLDGGSVTLPSARVRTLRAGLRGELLLPEDAGYDQARRVWNGMIDRRPALLLRCYGSADILRGVAFAREHRLLLSVRGGGHSISGQAVCEGGLMLDLSPMRDVRIDPRAQRAFVGPGTLLGALDHEAQAFGLATTAGTISHTGAAGLTLGGGFGRLGPMFGLACDNLVRADVVTADGRLARASADEDAELLWGLRGGGGNFGVVSMFEYQLHPLGPEIVGGKLVYAFEQARDVLAFYGELCARTPDELCVDYAIVCPPAAQPLVMVEVTCARETTAAARTLDELRAFGKPLANRIGRVAYAELQRSTDAGTAPGRQYYLKSGFLAGVAPGLIDELLGGFEPSASRALVLTFQQLGGAISRVPADATAFSHREATHALLMMSGWTNPAESPAHTAWVRAYWQRVAPFTNGFYVNSYTPDERTRVRSNYGGNYARLVQLKRRFDPNNLFRMNVNIEPAATPS